MVIILCAIVYGVVIANYISPAIRMTSPDANDLFFFAAQLLALPPMYFPVRRLLQRGHKAASALVVNVVLLLIVGYASFAVLLVFLSPPLVHISKPLASLTTSQGDVVAFLELSGGVSFRQQCRFISGFLVVRDLGGDFPAAEVRLSPDGKMVRAVVAGDNISRREAVHELELASLPCSFKLAG